MSKSSPDLARVIRIPRPGGPEVMELSHAPVREPGAEEIRIRVRASGVNRADLIQRRGGYPAPPGWPADIPGLEFAGRVSEVGPGVRMWKEGDAVMGIVGGGGYSSELVVHERAVIRIPEGMDPLEAAAIPEAFLTAWDALSLQGGMAAGETVLVHAVGSGVGTAALQLGRAAGAEVIGTSRTASKLERAEALGLARGVLRDSGGSDWVAGVDAATSARGVHLILELVGLPSMEGNLRVLREGGRILLVGVPGGSRGEIDLRFLMARRATLRGTVLRTRPLEERIRLAREFEERVVPLFENGVVRPVIDCVLPAGSVAEAHRLLEGNQTFGKVLLDWEG